MLAKEYCTSKYLKFTGCGTSDLHDNWYIRKFSVRELWRRNQQNGKKSPKKNAEIDDSTWYKTNMKYWNNVEASLSGVLGGFEDINEIDVHDSLEFIESNMETVLKYTGKESAGDLKVIDCGAGIGRVSENILLDKFGHVDLLEPSKDFLATAKSHIEANFAGEGKICEFFNCGIQEFDFSSHQYDIIWFQWVLDYITDADIQKVLSKLGNTSAVITKENITGSNLDFILDESDTGVIRSEDYLDYLFNLAGFKYVARAQQRNMPDGMYPVILKLYFKE